MNDIYKRNDAMKDKIKNLRRTIRHLTIAIENARAEIAVQNPAFADLILKDAINDSRYEFK